MLHVMPVDYKASGEDSCGLLTYYHAQRALAKGDKSGFSLRGKNQRFEYLKPSYPLCKVSCIEISSSYKSHINCTKPWSKTLLNKLLLTWNSFCFVDDKMSLLNSFCSVKLLF
jgi:hypothetical protein